MSLPRYLLYKDSGVDWLGQVPSHWECVRIATLFREVNEPGSDDRPILSVSIHDGVSDKELDEDEADRKVSRSDDRSKYKSVAPGDLTYNMMRAWQGGFGTVVVHGMVSPAYVVARPTKEFSTNQIEMLLRTPMAVSEMKRHSRGITDFRLRLYWDDFKLLQVALPPRTEQLAIAAFLDREVGKIDALIAEQEKLIALLVEKRQVTISEAVTRGLDPNASLTDSGVSWLGEVPSHWQTRRLKFVCNVQTGDKDTVNAKADGKFAFFVRSQTVERINSYTHDCEAVLTAGDGAGVGKVFHYFNGKFDFHQRVYMLNRFKFISGRFLFMYLATMFHKVALDGVAKSTVDSLRMPVFLNFTVTNPPPDEQKAILDFIDAETGKLDALKSEAERGVALLAERRGALIAAAVTGQIDVRGIVPADVEAVAA